jgi:hypothetical protein
VLGVREEIHADQNLGDRIKKLVQTQKLNRFGLKLLY